LDDPALWKCGGYFIACQRLQRGREYGRLGTPQPGLSYAWYRLHFGGSKVACFVSQSYNAVAVARTDVFSSMRGRNGFDGITGQKMRAEDHDLAKNMELKLTADQPLALAA
jgi:hypothetical protein